MERSSTSLFAIFLILSLGFLTYINFFKDSLCLTPFSYFVLPSVSIVLIIVIILLFIFREIENNKIQNQFITIITHKIKTPLTGIRWTIDMLEKDLTLLEKKDLLAEMQKANQRLMEIMDLLVHFAKFERQMDYELEDVSLRELVNISIGKNSANIKNKNIKFSIDSNEELPKVFVDKSKMQFVVDMIIDNAIKYTPNDGSVTALFELAGKSITLKVTDTGIGMSYFDSKRVFKHFFRSAKAKLMDTDGLGLGLYTARKIVNHHDGKLWAESKGLNKGSTFFLRLPIKR